MLLTYVRTYVRSLVDVAYEYTNTWVSKIVLSARMRYQKETKKKKIENRKESCPRRIRAQLIKRFYGRHFNIVVTTSKSISRRTCACPSVSKTQLRKRSKFRQDARTSVDALRIYTLERVGVRDRSASGGEAGSLADESGQTRGGVGG